MFVVVNFDGPAQASDIRIERDKLSSSVECRIRTQGLRHQITRRLNVSWQTDWAIEDEAKNVNSTVSEHSADSTPLPVGFRTWLWWYTCLLWLISMLWHRQAIFKSKGDKLSSSAECRIRTQGLRHRIYIYMVIGSFATFCNLWPFTVR